MERLKQKYLQSHVLQSHFQGFLENIDNRLIVKTQALEL